MSFYSDASLVMIPSGYKTSKVYSAVPTDGAGDLSFTRTADTATRVGPDGLIEKVRTNLFPTGSALLTTGWDIQDATLTAGQTDPDGGTGALRVQFAGGSGTDFIAQVFSGSNITYTRSVYIKAASSQTIRIVEPTSGANEIISLTTSYQRFDLTAAVSGGFFGIRFDNEHDSAAKDFTIAFVQIETGDIATDYIATTTAAVSVGPVANVPRLDYLNSSCPRLLLEPQRTNLATYSEQANQYTKAGATIGSNVVTSPDGYTNADSIIEDGNTTPHAFYNFGLTTFTAAAYTLSVFAKKGGRDWIRLSIYDGASNLSAYFNLNTGAVGNTSSVTTKIEDAGNGWYRCSITGTTLAASGGFAIYAASADNVDTYAGTNGLAAIYAYGWQLELGAYATSYIPTLGAAVTRGADAASKTGISSLIGQTEGTLFVEANLPSGYDGNNLLITASDGTSDNIIFINRVAGKAEYYIAAGGVSQVLFSMANVLSTGVHKLAVAYKANDFAFYVDGVLVNSDTSGSVPACSRVNVGSYVANALPYNDGISQAIIFPTRLSNADLAALTA